MSNVQAEWGKLKNAGIFYAIYRNSQFAYVSCIAYRKLKFGFVVADCCLARTASACCVSLILEFDCRAHDVCNILQICGRGCLNLSTDHLVVCPQRQESAKAISGQACDSISTSSPRHILSRQKSRLSRAWQFPSTKLQALRPQGCCLKLLEVPGQQPDTAGIRCIFSLVSNS